MGLALVVSGAAFASGGTLPAWATQGTPQGKVAPDANSNDGVDTAQKLPMLPRFKWSVPGELAQIPMPGKHESLGIPMDLHAVVSSKDLDTLYTHFNQEFLKAGLYIPPKGHVQMPLKHPNLTALDPSREVSYTVILVQNPDGTITCILGEARLGQRRSTPSVFAPVHPSGSKPAVMRVEGMRTLTYFASASESEVQHFYREELGKRGFKEIEAGKYRRSGQRGGELWWVHTTRVEGRTRVSVIDSAMVPTQELETVHGP